MLNFFKLFFILVLIAINFSVYAETKIKQISEDKSSTHIQDSHQKQTQDSHHLQTQDHNLPNLFNEHGVLLNKAILAALHDEPKHVIEAGKKKLLENSHAISNVIGASKGKEAAKSFEELFNEHISLGSQLIEANKSKDQDLANKVTEKAKANGRAIAKFLSNLSEGVSLDSWNKMLDKHVSIEGDQIKAYFDGDQKKGDKIRDESLSQLKEMANSLSKALSQQTSSKK